ncbi:MAG TPA: hypothetical protein VH496_11985 [Mycobacterium sp.]
MAGAPAASAAATSQSQAQIRSVNADVNLTGSIFNVGYNLFADVVNIPQNENNALNFAARSLLFSGPWFVVSNINLWGVDPGDPPHFQSVTNFLLPIPALSGMNTFNDYATAQGFGGQMWHLAAALLPVNKQCDAYSCSPTVPVSPITGIGGLDSLIWYGLIATGGQEFPIIYNWFSEKAFDGILGIDPVTGRFTGDGYTFDTEPGITDPSGPVNDMFGFQGTHVDPVTGEYVMPWEGTTFKFQPLLPIKQYLQHLWNDTPATNPIQLPNILQLARNLQALAAASVMAFDPFTPGSPFCKGECAWITKPRGPNGLSLDYPDLIRRISNLWPGNPLLDGSVENGDPYDGWLTAYDKGEANIPTQDQIERSIKILQQPFWDFANPLPPTGSTPAGFDVRATAQAWHDFWVAAGFTDVPDCFCQPDPDPQGDWNYNTTLAAPVTAAASKEMTPTDQTDTGSTTVGQPTGGTTVDLSNGSGSGSGTGTGTTGTGTTGTTGTGTTGTGTTNGRPKLGGWYPGKNLLKLGSGKGLGSSKSSGTGTGSGSGSGTSSNTGGTTPNTGTGTGSGSGSGSNTPGSSNSSSGSSGSGSGSGK